MSYKESPSMGQIPAPGQFHRFWTSEADFAGMQRQRIATGQWHHYDHPTPDLWIELPIQPGQKTMLPVNWAHPFFELHPELIDRARPVADWCRVITRDVLREAGLSLSGMRRRKIATAEAVRHGVRAVVSFTATDQSYGGHYTIMPDSGEGKGASWVNIKPLSKDPAPDSYISRRVIGGSNFASIGPDVIHLPWDHGDDPAKFRMSAGYLLISDIAAVQRNRTEKVLQASARGSEVVEEAEKLDEPKALAA